MEGKIKLVIPSEFQMGCRVFKVRVNEKLLQELDYKAQLQDKEDLVRLSRRSQLSMFESLVHEMLHEAAYLCNEDSSDEKIQPKATFMAQAFLSLGLDPDFSQILEEE